MYLSSSLNVQNWKSNLATLTSFYSVENFVLSFSFEVSFKF